MDEVNEVVQLQKKKFWMVLDMDTSTLLHPERMAFLKFKVQKQQQKKRR